MSTSFLSAYFYLDSLSVLFSFNIYKQKKTCRLLKFVHLLAVKNKNYLANTVAATLTAGRLFGWPDTKKEWHLKEWDLQDNVCVGLFIWRRCWKPLHSCLMNCNRKLSLTVNSNKENDCALTFNQVILNTI